MIHTIDPISEGKQKAQAGVGGGGVTLFLSSYIGSGPASTIHPNNISGISSTPKKYLNFSNPKKYPPFCTLTFKIRP